MAALEHGLLEALQNLARKQAGEEVDWISIACARTLTDLGYAQRTASGWTITASGSALLESSEKELRRTPSALPMTRAPKR